MSYSVAPLRLERRNVVRGSLVTLLWFVPLASGVGAVMAGSLFWPAGLFVAAVMATLVAPIAICVLGLPLLALLQHLFKSRRSRALHSLLALTSGLITGTATVLIAWPGIFSGASSGRNQIIYGLALIVFAGISAFVGWWSAVNRQVPKDVRDSRLDSPVEAEA